MTTKLLSRSLTPVLKHAGIRSLVEFGRTPVPRVHPVLYPRLSYTRLHLNAYRGEPAITALD